MLMLDSLRIFNVFLYRPDTAAFYFVLFKEWDLDSPNTTIKKKAVLSQMFHSAKKKCCRSF